MVIKRQFDHVPIPIIRKPSKKNIKTIIKTQAVDFCLATGLHGYKYIVQTERTKTERVIWGVIVISSLCCSLVCMQIAWKYNSTHPTLTVIESTHNGIWNYPFPAVTICNNNQVSLNKAQTFVNNLIVLGNLSRNYILSEMRLLVELLDPGVFEYDVDSNLTILQDIFNANNYSIFQVMNLVKQDCSRLLHSCRWKGNIIPCEELFQTYYTRDGICCSFNYYDEIDRARKNITVKRLTACGYQTGLIVLVNAEPEDYHASLYASYGVKIMLHYPFSYPDRNADFKIVGLGVQAFLGIAPEETYATAGVESLPARVRDCIIKKEELTSEIQYRIKNYTWGKYSFLNCLNECRANLIVHNCGCVPYYIPQNGNNRVCNLKDIKCLKSIRALYDTSWPGKLINNSNLHSLKKYYKNRPCGCALDCRINSFTVEITKGSLNSEKIYIGKNTYEMREFRNLSRINIFFTDLVSIKYRRDIFYNWKNLFASFGGLLGLFVGFTLTTAFELIYFFVVRVIIRKCMRRNKQNNICFIH